MITFRIFPPNGPAYEKEFDLESIAIGRSSQVEMPIADRAMSRRHARFFCEEGVWKVEDLGSRNGTFFDGQPVESPQRLTPGSRVEIGNSTVEMIVPGSAMSTGSGAGQTLFKPAAELLGEAEAASGAGMAAEGADQQRFVDRLRMLNDVHRALASSIAIDELLDLILDRTFEHLKPEEAAIFLREGDGPLRRAASRSLKGSRGDAGLDSTHLAEEVVGKAQAALVIDAQMDGRFNQAMSLLDAGIRSLVAAPLLEPDGASGMIVVASRVTVREYTEEDMNLLTSLASVAAMRIRNVRLAKEAAERHRLEQEVALARKIQVTLLPDSIPDVPGYELHGGNIPSRGVSGDFYKLTNRNDARECVIMLSDVSGKGIAAALLTASLEALSAPIIESGAEPTEICARASRLLFERTPPAKYSTCFFAILDREKNRLCYVNAGHNPGILLRADGEESEWLASTGMPIGIMEGAVYSQKEVDLRPGDTVVMYTDGITEAENPEEEEYSEDRLRLVAEKNRHRSLNELAEAVEEDLNTFVQGVPFVDDRTLVLLRRLGLEQE